MKNVVVLVLRDTRFVDASSALITPPPRADNDDGHTSSTRSPISASHYQRTSQYPRFLNTPMPRKEAIQPPATAQAQQEAVSDGIDNYELPKSLVTRIAKSAVSSRYDRRNTLRTSYDVG